MFVNVYLLPEELFIPSHNLSIAETFIFIPCAHQLSTTSAPEYELETLTGKRDWALEEPPEYATVMVTKDDTQPPDYFDDIVNKVQI